MPQDQTEGRWREKEEVGGDPAMVHLEAESWEWDRLRKPGERAHWQVRRWWQLITHPRPLQSRRITQDSKMY